VSVRPERITLAEASTPARLSAVVKSAIFLGADTLIELDSGGTALRARIRGVHMPAPGTQTGLYWPDEAEWVLRE